jgi:hypothetical protein
MSHRVKADDGRIWLFDKVLIEQRGVYWHFRMWLDGENKYVRESLKTRDLETAKKTSRRSLHRASFRSEVWQTLLLDYSRRRGESLSC